MSLSAPGPFNISEAERRGVIVGHSCDWPADTLSFTDQAKVQDAHNRESFGAGDW